ncbi:MAG: hypothetical protein MUP98_15635, partial [Candidatus Aminicenantes bacterium]|nr:hypothetical protein [Candidatus Aminicenantes bacterium]
MEKSTKKWFIGCGIGCGALVIILLVLLALGFFFVKDMVNKFEETGELTNSLKDLYGEIEDYMPPPDGRIPFERMEAFLYVRESLIPVRDRLDRSISLLDSMRNRETRREEPRRPGRVFRAFKAGFDLIPGIGDYYSLRSQSLLEVEMGLGEYMYIYILSYYSMLEKPPGDGPDFQLLQDDKEWNFNEWNREDNLEERNVEMTEKINQMILLMLKNQVAQLDSPSSGPGVDEWRGAFLAEI